MNAAFPGTGPGRAGQPRRLPPPAQRGATVIPDKVVARIAAQAARTAQARQTGGPSGHPGVDTPEASATTRGGSARLALSVDLPYPADLADLSRRIQHDVAERVAQLTGLHVREVALTVRRLVPGDGLDRRRVR